MASQIDQPRVLANFKPQRGEREKAKRTKDVERGVCLL